METQGTRGLLRYEAAKAEAAGLQLCGRRIWPWRFHWPVQPTASPVICGQFSSFAEYNCWSSCLPSYPGCLSSFFGGEMGPMWRSTPSVQLYVRRTWTLAGLKGTSVVNKLSPMTGVWIASFAIAVLVRRTEPSHGLFVSSTAIEAVSHCLVYFHFH